MSKPKVQVVILCEDRQTDAFARAYLKCRGYTDYQIRTRMSPSAQGSAHTYVLNSYPQELEGRRHDPVNRALAVFIDEDGKGAASLLRQLDKACGSQQVAPRDKDDRVGVFTPARNIETWLAYLSGQQVDETADYKKSGGLVASRKPASRLHGLCRAGTLPEDAPPQLRQACVEFSRLCLGT